MALKSTKEKGLDSWFALDNRFAQIWLPQAAAGWLPGHFSVQSGDFEHSRPTVPFGRLAPAYNSMLSGLQG
ncbi:MAG TPA: hypothetical protein PK918_07295 [Methanotrichaceae archaeon]|nr:hypothetical protein [Methanotrichaceae archaeon]HQI91962.1 hypothetical protein [Methanotrichaceae archaeon]